MIDKNTPFQASDFAVFLHSKIKEEGYTVKKLVDASGIAVKHIESLLDSDFNDLPPAPYLRGYLYTLGEILHFDADPWWHAIKEGSTVQKSGMKDSMPNNRFARNYPIGKILIAGAILLIITILVWRIPKIFGTPELTISSPASQTETVKEELYTIRGSVADANDAVSINGERISTDNDGFWQKTILLQNGINIFEITAKKQLGREATQTRQVIYEMPEATTPTKGTQPKNTSSTQNTASSTTSSTATTTKKH